MRVYISVDMEGIAGVVHWADTKLEGVEYERARRWMTGEANAAIEGALAAGATEVVVNDSHGHMRNLLVEELHTEAWLVRGSPKPYCMLEGLEPGFDAVFLVGYHALAGTGGGVLNHSFSGSAIAAMRLNGLLVGEVGFNAALAFSHPGSTRPTLARALGPCTAIIARSSRGVSLSCGARSAIRRRNHAMSLSAVPALTTMRKKSSRRKYTIRSSSTPPSGARRHEYSALPGACSLSTLLASA